MSSAPLALTHIKNEETTNVFCMIYFSKQKIFVCMMYLNVVTISYLKPEVVEIDQISFHTGPMIKFLFTITDEIRRDRGGGEWHSDGTSAHHHKCLYFIPENPKT